MGRLFTSALLLSAVAGWTQSPTPTTRNDQSDGRVYRVGGGVTAPTLLYKVEPEYSEEALSAKYQGAVLLYVQVDPSGKAVNMRVLHSLGMGLDEKAMEAVKKWKFEPGLKDWKPVTVEAQIEVNFRLRETE
jgi:TonB family protein